MKLFSSRDGCLRGLATGRSVSLASVAVEAARALGRSLNGQSKVFLIVKAILCRSTVGSERAEVSAQAKSWRDDVDTGTKITLKRPSMTLPVRDCRAALLLGEQWKPSLAGERVWNDARQVKRWSVLNDRQLAVLKRVAGGDDLSGPDSLGDRQSAYALSSRGLIEVSKRGGVFRAQMSAVTEGDDVGVVERRWG